MANELINAVAKEFMISVDDIKSKNRTEPLPTARQIAGFLLTRTLTVIQAGEALNISHSGVVRNNQSVIERLQFDNKFRAHFNNILEQLNIAHDIDMKITYEQLKELKNLLEYFIDGYRPSNEMEQLLKNNLVSVYEKVRKRVIYNKSNCVLNPNEQLAFRHWQQHLHLMPNIQKFRYAENVCRIIVNQLHIDYG